MLTISQQNKMYTHPSAEITNILLVLYHVVCLQLAGWCNCNIISRWHDWLRLSTNLLWGMMESKYLFRFSCLLYTSLQNYYSCRYAHLTNSNVCHTISQWKGISLFSLQGSKTSIKVCRLFFNPITKWQKHIYSKS